MNRYDESRLSSVSPFEIDWITRMPSSAANAEPRPPKRLVPPITAAAIALRLTSPPPLLWFAAASRAAASTPPSAANVEHIMLDEPTAALGVAQTAEVLNLIERLRERGHGVIMISHNMADVKAVADTVVVLRLGRNNGRFRVDEVSQEEIVAAITGASDNAVSRRAARDVEEERP